MNATQILAHPDQSLIKHLLGVACRAKEFASWPPDERLAAEFHRRICHDLVPDWAGRWRTIEVRVGNVRAAQTSKARPFKNEYLSWGGVGVTNASTRLQKESGKT
jgi:fido (protein-threonine AMPylation protein)